MQTGHFTQVVWKSSTLLGCTAKVCDQIQGLPGWTEGGTLVICRYSPAGNVEGQYRENVFPPAASAPAPSTIPGGWVLTSTSCLSSVDARFTLCVQVRHFLISSTEMSKFQNVLSASMARLPALLVITFHYTICHSKK